MTREVILIGFSSGSHLSDEGGGMGPDPHLAGVSELLGPRAREILAPAVGAAGGRLHTPRATQIRYEPGCRLVVRYAAEVTWHGGARRVETLGALVDRGGLPDGLAVLETDSGGRVGVWRYPHDPFLPGLPHAAYPDGARRVLARLGLRAAHVGVVPVVYRPGSRAVLRVEVGDTVVYLKVVRPGEVEPLRRAHELIGAHVRVPRCLGWSDALGLVALETLPGRTLARPLVDGGKLPLPAAVLGLAGRLAEAPIGRPPHSVAAVVAAHARLLRAVVPEATGQVEDVAEIASGAAALPDRTIHGDFYEAQVLVDEEGAVSGLLDVEGARCGAAHEDPARLVAHLAALAHVHPRAAARIDAYRNAVLACQQDTFAPGLLRLAAAGVLLGLATTPFRRQEPDWPARTLRWLELASWWAAAEASRRT